ncbi:PHP domain-containing protein [Amnibacterium sp. CER49]|uniref:PHP domain-containing protein n=1 Tax=Amnibacterium sp. CER49 TaxID=3039161 RepID=UPI00244B8671|nr:PHP domain-containing protein [Amnibacterium sp. CER49]MDH2445282.1 PHP domain-containing protein [Amnibacterium sp. CER49]
MALPADSHVHTEWSWDSPLGDMAGTCARAVELGLPAVVLTEHLDTTVWRPLRDDGIELPPGTGADGLLRPPPLDVDGYLESVERCRIRFPGLRILTGAELGEPHRNIDAARPLLDAGGFDRVLGSLHSIELEGEFVEPPTLFAALDPDEVLQRWFGELADLAGSPAPYDVLTHLDYPLRHRPVDAPPFAWSRHEAGVREALSRLAGSGRALELNTRLPLTPMVLLWWIEEGGRTISIGSDAHRPEDVGRGLQEAAAVAGGLGFGPGERPADLWRLG